MNASQATDRAESIVRRAGKGEHVYFVDRSRAGHGCVVSAEGKSEERRHWKKGKGSWSSEDAVTGGSIDEVHMLML